MTTIAQVRLRAVSGFADGAVAFFRAMADAFVKARACDIAYRELSALSDRDLADLGIERVRIAEVVRRSVYGD
jgi:uncharacterized protein YjiS (DUF1127 family)